MGPRPPPTPAPRPRPPPFSWGGGGAFTENPGGGWSSRRGGGGGGVYGEFGGGGRGAEAPFTVKMSPLFGENALKTMKKKDEKRPKVLGKALQAVPQNRTKSSVIGGGGLNQNPDLQQLVLRSPGRWKGRGVWQQH